jgi:hypothetical protein
MAAKPETNFTTRIHKRLPLSIYKMKNNNQYTGGIPDVWYSGKSGDLWVEYKYLPKTPVRAVTDPKKLLSALQLQWLNARKEEGRNVAVIIGCPDGGVLLSNGVWNEEIPASNFTALIVSVNDLAAFIEGQVA